MQYKDGVKQPGRRSGMAVIVIQEFEATTDQYDEVNEKLGGEAPDGLIAHAGAESGNGKIKVVDIWESKGEVGELPERPPRRRGSRGDGPAARRSAAPPVRGPRGA
jgi:hypothetical protein